jgi:hypothetical protein
VPGPAVPSPQQHANSDAAIRDVTCLFAAGRYKPAKNKDAHRREHDFHLGAQVPALMVRHHIRMNGHRFRGSHHGTMNIHHAMYARDVPCE